MAAEPNVVVPAQPLHAGFWRRVAAYLLDGLVLLVPNFVLGYVMDGYLGLLAQSLLWFVYKVGMESSATQGTLGKKWLGTKVTDADGERITPLRALGRAAASIPAGLLLCLGFVMAAFTAKRQGLHDLMASTLVVRTTATPEEARAGGKTMPMTAGVWIAVVVFMLIPVAGVVAAVAIPAYQDYLMRSKIHSAVLEGTQWQADVGTGQGVAEKVKGASPWVDHIYLDRPGRSIRVVIRDDAFRSRYIGPDAHIVLKQGSDGVWTCTVRNIEKRYVAPQCRS